MKAMQRGGMMVLAAGIILFLTSFAVMGLDIGRIMVVRNEMQNAADAAALAGANCLTRTSPTGSPTTCTATLSGTLNWTAAQARASAQLASNMAEGTPLATTGAGVVVDVGYWDLLNQRPSGGTFSTAATGLGTNDRPAVRVEVRKDAGVNNGPIRLLTRLIYGWGADVPMSAESVAVVSAPGSVPGNGSVVPIVISKCMFDLYWNSATGSPRIYNGPGSVPADPLLQSQVGQPYTLRIISSYHYPGCEASGQWTTFDNNTNSGGVLKNLIASGNPVDLEIGDTVWVRPGTVNSGYTDLASRYPTLPTTVNVVVVEDADLSHLPPDGRKLPIVAFAGFKITSIVGGAGKYVQGQFVPANVVGGGSGVGPFYGTYTPPRLAH